jgi:hypothetical protein
MELTKDQRQRLRAALMSMCRDREAVNELAFQAFGVDLEQITTSDGAVGQLLIDVVLHAERRQVVKELIEAAMSLLENGPVPQTLPDTHPLKQLQGELGRQ